jgi:hypothetical protein
MKLRPLAIVALLAALLTSCSPTKYVPAKSSSDFGFVEIPVDDNTFRISFHGNMYTDFETVDRYALYRAAELTESKGFDYFVIAESASGGTTIGGVSKHLASARVAALVQNTPPLRR